MDLPIHPNSVMTSSSHNSCGVNLPASSPCGSTSGSESLPCLSSCSSFSSSSSSSDSSIGDIFRIAEGSSGEPFPSIALDVSTCSFLLLLIFLMRIIAFLAISLTRSVPTFIAFALMSSSIFAWSVVLPLINPASRASAVCTFVINSTRCFHPSFQYCTCEVFIGFISAGQAIRTSSS